MSRGNRLDCLSEGRIEQVAVIPRVRRVFGRLNPLIDSQHERYVPLGARIGRDECAIGNRVGRCFVTHIERGFTNSVGSPEAYLGILTEGTDSLKTSEDLTEAFDSHEDWIRDGTHSGRS